MKVRNRTTKIINMGTVALLPDTACSVPVGYESNEVVRALIERGSLEAVEEPAHTDVAPPPPGGDGTPGGGPGEPDPAAEEGKKPAAKGKASKESK